MSNEKPTSRRDFLRGKSAGRALLDAARVLVDRTVDALPGGPVTEAAQTFPRRPSSTEPRLYTSRRAMACEFAIEHHAADGPEASEAVIEALDLIVQIEDQLSIYREHTEVSAINRMAAERALEVEPRLFTLLELCGWLYGSTGGAYDITSGPLSRGWGFLKREGRLPSHGEIAVAMALVGFDKVELDATGRTIRFLQPGVEINFNSVGKGYALDCVAELLAERGVNDYLCHGGRSSVLARGRDRSDRDRGWAIAIPHPLVPERQLGEIILNDAALGTSGSGTQFFEHEGRRYGHLLDPRTGWPVEGIYTATAVAATAAEADALATAFYIMGPGDTAEYCAQHGDVAAVLVCPGVGRDAVDVHALNLADGRWIPNGL